MPYSAVGELPERIRSKYGAKAQRAFMHAFNSAYAGTCKEREDREGCAFAIGTAAAQRAEKQVKMLKALLGWMGVRERKSEAARFSHQVSIIKLDDEKQIAYGPVLEPEVEDAQGDIMTMADIEEAAHRFLLKAQLGKASADGVNHEIWVGYSKAHVVESWVTHEDMRHGDEIVRKGTWMIGVHVADNSLWDAVKKGELVGFSIGGRGVRL